MTYDIFLQEIARTFFTLLLVSFCLGCIALIAIAIIKIWNYKE